MWRIICIAFCWGLSVHAEELEITGLQPWPQPAIAWTQATQLVVESAPQLGGAFSYASEVLNTNHWPIPATQGVLFLRLEKVVTVPFLDTALLNAVRDAIGQALGKLAPTSLVYDVELARLGDLAAPFLGITSLQGLEFATALTNLVLAGNLASDLSPLQEWTDLVTLDVGDNALTNLAPLAAMVKLRELYADQNALTTLDGLQNKPSLEQLFVAQNELVDIAALSGATNLQVFSAANNQLSQLNALAPLLRLETVDISNNPGLDSLTPLLDNATAGGLGAGDSVYIYSNTSIPAGQITTLQAYGVSVFGP